MENDTTYRARRQTAFQKARKDMEINAPDRARQLSSELSATPLDYCHISSRASPKPETHPALDEGVVRIYTNDLEVKRYSAKRGGARRGEIVGFSDGSRGRFLKKLNRLHWPEGICYFLGLTFPDDFPSPQEAKRCFRALLKRIQREWPEFEDMWREEFKRRKSGAHAGQIAPHFHMFAWGISAELDDFIAWLRNAWTEIAGAADPVNHHEHGCDVKPVNDRKHAAWYISKYMSKSENDEQIKGGRAWGHSSGLDFSPLQVIRMTQAKLAALRLLIEALLLQRGSSFWYKLMQYPMWLGYHVYGIAETEVRALLEEAEQMARLLQGQSILGLKLEGVWRE